MSKTHLRKLFTETIIKTTSKSKGQEKDIVQALEIVVERLKVSFPQITLEHSFAVFLKDIIHPLQESFPDVEFGNVLTTSFMKPDGGILYLKDLDGNNFPILISEAKNQGTNDMRAIEGLNPQAMGNAIERLGKNVIGFRTYLLTENIFPFVCFGYGYDFKEQSSILDRVVTIAMFGKLNEVYLDNKGSFNRGSFFFRREKWTIDEMTDKMYNIAERSIFYYFSKYGKEAFNNERSINT